LALFILAGVVLVPAYIRLTGAEYQLTLLKKNVEDAEAMVAAYDNVLAAAQNDEILTRRMARSQLGLLPTNEVLVMDPAGPASLPPGVIITARKPPPQPPGGPLTLIASRLEKPNIRRGLLVVAAGLLLAATVLFAPPETQRNR
jgi:hypothetical protein